MGLSTIFRVLGILLMIFSLSMLAPAGIALYYNDDTWTPFAVSFCMTFSTGLICWMPTRKLVAELKIRDGFVVVVMFWTVLSLFGAIPLLVSHFPQVSFTDAVFESFSGLTTTGATVLTGIDYLPHAIRFYRQELQFLGGMGIVVLAVAILPMLGIGGLQLYRAEIPGPAKDSKLTPRITQTAQALWYIYVGLTALCALAYWAAGMSLFDAIGESFATISTGGFSTHDASFAFYNSPFVNMVAVVFMILGSTNFSLHFLAIRNRSLQAYSQDQEFRVYMGLLIFSVVICAAMLIYYHVYTHPSIAINKAIFNAVSLGTNTGFTSAPFQGWPTFLPFWLMYATMIGGCAASTSGGLKVVRVLLLYKQGMREIKRLIHPSAVLTLKFGRQILNEDLLHAIWGFIAAFIVLFIILLLVLLADGLNFETSFGALVACLANAGVGVGDVSGNFEGINDFSKWVLIFAMLAGRLEIFTLMVLFTPAFWKR